MVRGGAYSFRELLRYCDGVYLGQPSVFFSRAAYQAVGGVDPSLQYAMDLDLWLRLRARFDLYHVPRRLSQMRVHREAKGQDPNQLILREAAKVTRRHWGAVSAGERLRLRFGLRAMRAREYCKQGLEHVARQDRRGGWDALARAVALYPLILTYRPAQSLAARVALPPALRARMLRVP
jgi:hypothetical protein